MPELPDIVVLARSMQEALRNQRIVGVAVNQPKCLNLPVAKFSRSVSGLGFRHIKQRGKWVLAEMDKDWTLAFNQGMGGEVQLHKPDEVPDPKRERVVFRLDDQSQIWVHHWWYGHVHLVEPGKLGAHPQIGKLGAEPLAEDFTVERLGEMLAGRRGRIKSYLLDQKFIAGIGNVYVQDILWHARLHPLRKTNTLNASDVARLHKGIRHVLGEGIRWGGGPGEQDVWGNKGRYAEHLQVGYRTGKPCPACGTLIEELRVGSTTSYICPKCQIAP
ncbi:MAG: Fpg/Nei family DNA glycosylase [Promethearchaeota archaeon]